MPTATTTMFARGVLTLAIASAAFAAPAAPAPGASPATQQQPPTELRRTALVVSDMDASLAFYRDALGLVVMDDRSRRSPSDTASDAEATSITRLILFRSKDDHVGQLELIHIAKPARPAPAPGGKRQLGGFAIMFGAKDLKATFEKARAVPGVQVAEAPRLKTYPSYGGQGTTTDWFCSMFDPDGNFVEINQPTVERAPPAN